MAEYYPFIKALHLIFVVTWFAGLFYLPRLFIYHIESGDKGQAQAEVLSAQFRLMERRLWYIITWPSAVLCTLFAFTLLAIMPEWLEQGWMHIKLGFVVLLWIYHLVMHRYVSEIPGGRLQLFLRFYANMERRSNPYLVCDGFSCRCPAQPELDLRTHRAGFPCRAFNAWDSPL